MKKTIDMSPRIADILQVDEAHLAEDMECYAYLLRDAIKANEQAFSAEEWRLMAVASIGAKFDPQLGPVETLVGRVKQEAQYGDSDELDSIDVDELEIKIRSLDPLHAWAVVEVLQTAHTLDMDTDVAWWTLSERKHILTGTAQKSSAGKGGLKKGKRRKEQEASAPIFSSVLPRENGSE